MPHGHTSRRSLLFAATLLYMSIDDRDQRLGVNGFDEVMIESRFSREASLLFLAPASDGDKEYVGSPVA